MTSSKIRLKIKMYIIITNLNKKWNIELLQKKKIL